MGAASNKPDQHLKYEFAYKLDDLEGVRSILDDFLRLETRRYTGDEAASDLIIDLKEAIRLAKLTDKQRDVLQLHYVYGYKQREIGAQLGIERSVVSRHLLAAEKKITKVYAHWSKLDRIGGYSI